ncbi:MAG: heavy-metal-associated domain-containing protein [Phycisphaerales bacterium]
MQSATHSIHTLNIDGMNGDTCIKKVTHALKDVKDIVTKSVKLGSASIDASQDGTNAACKAISSIGFKTHEVKAGIKTGIEPSKDKGSFNQQSAAAKAADKSIKKNS